MKKFVFTLERMLAYQEQNLEKEKGILARIMAVTLCWRESESGWKRSRQS